MVPLWGVRGAADWVTPNPQATRTRTDEAGEKLAALVGTFMEHLLGSASDPDALADTIHDIYRFFGSYDFDTTMASRAVWERYVSVVERHFPSLARAHGYESVPVALSDLTEGSQYLRSWLQVLAQRLPDIDVVHAAMAGMCSLIAVAAKRDRGAGFLLTEHGIYLRECYLTDAGTRGSLFLKLLRLRFALRTTQLSYAMADQISPCCNNHQRWELRIGAAPSRVSTIYYGVDSSIFSRTETPRPSAPVVVWVGRIDPLKDVETLLRAAAIVADERPDIGFRLYGAALPGGEAYYERCLALRRELGLEEVVAMPGYTSSPQDAFNEGDLIVLCSISEGLPYSIVEAMLCSRAIVATAVGGIAEQIGDCGVVVEPRNPAQLAGAILTLMRDPVALESLGRLARARAEALFSVEQECHQHLSAYIRLTPRLTVATAAAAAPDVNDEIIDLDNDEIIDLEGETWTEGPFDVCASMARRRDRREGRGAATCAPPDDELELVAMSAPQPAAHSGRLSSDAMKLGDLFDDSCHVIGCDEHVHTPVLDDAVLIGHESHLSSSGFHPMEVGDGAGFISEEEVQHFAYRFRHAIGLGMPDGPDSPHLDISFNDQIWLPFEGRTSTRVLVQPDPGPTAETGGEPSLHCCPDQSTIREDAVAQATVGDAAGDAPEEDHEEGNATGHELADLDALKAEVERRVPLPLDELEVTAVLESLGITDQVARRYGADNSFDIADTLLADIRRTRKPPALTSYEPPPIPFAATRTRDSANFVLTAMPAVAAIGAVQLLSERGGIGHRSSWAVMIGILAGVFVTNGLLQALTPRASLYIGCGNWQFARKLVGRFSKLSLAAVATLAALAYLTASLAGLGSATERQLFVVGFAAASLLWIISAGLVVAQRLHAVGGMIGAAAAVTTGADVVLRSHARFHALISISTGYTLLIGALLVSSRRLYRARGASSLGPGSLPPLRRLLPEALPYSLYGLLVMGVLVSPHVIGILVLQRTEPGKAMSFRATELSLNLTLLPLLTSTVIAHRSLRQFWPMARDLQMRTLLSSRGDFATGLRAFYYRRLLILTGYLTITTLLGFVAFDVVLRHGTLDGLVPPPLRGVAEAVVALTLLGYLVFGLTLFNGVFSQVLRQPQLAVRALLVGVAVLLLSGLATWAWSPPALAPLALLSGTVASVVYSHAKLRAVLHRADHSYVAAL